MSAIHIVIPCFNEANRLDQERLLAFLRSHQEVRVTLVDDGSTDQTPEILNRLAQSRPHQIDVLACEKNGGKAEAVRLGLLHTLQFPTDAIGFLDADFSAPPEQCLALSAVLTRNRRVNIVLGSRFPMAGRQIERHLLRKLLGRCFSTAASMAIGVRLFDTQCGIKLFRPCPAIAQALTEPFHSRWIFDVELIARYLSLGPSATGIYEHPLDCWTEVPGSKLRPRDFVRAAGELLAIAWHYRSGHYPNAIDVEAAEARPVSQPWKQAA